jgi:peptide/nickel transport system substrate-binding protein
MGTDTGRFDGVLTRRRALAGGAAVAGGIAGGCLNPVDRLFGGSTTEPVAVEILTLPADEDEDATRIARQLLDRLRAVGIEATITLLPPLQLQERVLLQQDFDIYVGTMPVPRDPGFLRGLLHSRYIERLGWENPFGFTNATLSEALDEQRYQTGPQRIDTFREVQRTVASEQPYTPLVVEQAIASVGTDRFDQWMTVPARDPLWLAGIEYVGDGGDRSLTVATTDREITQNTNPIRPRFGELDVTTTYLYDRLARYYDGALRPWLAESWSREGSELTVRLRPELHWHDGAALTASDVAFTYRFLADTSLGESDVPLPAPRFQNAVSLVEAVAAPDDRTVRLSVDAAGIAALAPLTVPLLPEHVWSSRTAVTDPKRGLTEAMTRANTDPVGSGPLAFESRVEWERLDLTRFDDHPLNREGSDLFDVQFSPLSFTDLRFLIAPSDVTAVEHIEQGTADVTAPNLRSSAVSRIVRSDEQSLLVTPSRTMYHVGYNCRRQPLRNPNFRRAVARLLDKGAVASGAFDGFADPATSPLIDTTWVPSSLRWDGSDPEVPFSGEDGELNTETAKRQFVDAGYVYSDDGQLIYR